MLQPPPTTLVKSRDDDTALLPTWSVAAAERADSGACMEDEIPQRVAQA